MLGLLPLDELVRTVRLQQDFEHPVADAGLRAIPRHLFEQVDRRLLGFVPLSREIGFLVPPGIGRGPADICCATSFGNVASL
jgi:hypothetical protein